MECVGQSIDWDLGLGWTARWLVGRSMDRLIDALPVMSISIDWDCDGWTLREAGSDMLIGRGCVVGFVWAVVGRAHIIIPR